MKMKNGDEKNEEFFYFAKMFQIIFFWNFELCWFQICLQIFHILLRSKVIAPQSWLKMVKNGQKQAKWTHFGFQLSMEQIYEKSEYIFEISEVQSFRKIYIEIFWSSRKNLHFQMFWKFLKLCFLPLRIIFSTRYYF